MNFKASKPDARILILQIVAACILSFYFKSQLATFCFFLVIDFLILFWYGAKVFFQRLVAYVCLNALTWGLLIVEIPVLSVVLPSFLMMIVRVFPIYLLLKLLMVCISRRILQPYMVDDFRFRWDILYPTVYFSETAPQAANRISPFPYGAG